MKAMRTRVARIAVAALTVMLSAADGTAVSHAQSGSWLDQPLVNWNQPGMPIPTPDAGPYGAGTPGCTTTFRWAETPQDEVLTEGGWSLQSPYRAGWGQTVVDAASGYDGMCRPLGYNAFVFQHGVFAGTISPELMTRARAAPAR